YDDKVRRDAGFNHGLDDAHEFAPVTDAQLEADRLAAGQLAQISDEADQLKRRREGAMCRGRVAVDAHWDTARLGSFGGDLGGRQHAAVAGLRALAEFEFDHLDLRVARLLGEFLGVEPPGGIAAAKIARGNLIDQVATARAVISADTALAGIMRKTTYLCP